MPSSRLIVSQMLTWTYVQIVYQMIMNDGRGLFLPGGLSGESLRIMSNIIFLSLSGAAGMAFFALYYRRIPAAIKRSSIICAVLIACLGQILMELFPTEAMMAVGLLLSMLGWGYLMAYILYRAALEVSDAYFGRFIGISLGFGSILAFIIGAADAVFTDMLASRILAIPGLITLALIKPADEYLAIRQPPSPIWHSFFQKSHTYLVISAIIMGIMLGLCDSISVFHFPEYLPSFPSSRLFYAGGLFLFGWLADKKLSVMPAIVLIVSIYFLWYRTFSTEPGLFLLSAMLVEAIYSSPIIVLLMTAFLHIAAHSDNPEKWAAMSRIIELPALSLGLLLGFIFFQYVYLPISFTVYTVMLMISVALLYKISILYMHSLAEHNTEKSSEPVTELKQPEEQPDEQDRYIRYCEHYNLTEREADVLQELLKGHKISAIAENLFISERTVRFHITNLLNKTGQDSQLSMVSDYYRNINNVT